MLSFPDSKEYLKLKANFEHSASNFFFKVHSDSIASGYRMEGQNPMENIERVVFKVTACIFIMKGSK